MGDENYNLNFEDSAENFVVEFGEVTQIQTGGTDDFNELTNRPSYDGQPMTGETNIPAVPTKTSDLENDSDYQTGEEVSTAISEAVASKQDILTAGTGIDITGDEISVDTNTIQEKLTAGDNITITDNVISAAGGGATYEAGNAIDITGNVISAEIYPADYFIGSETVEDTGTLVTLDDTMQAKIKDVELLGNTEQDGTPTPDNPVDVDVVTGEQKVNVYGKNLLNPASIDNGVMLDNETNTFVLDRAEQRVVRFECSPYLPAGDYTISFDVSDNNTASGVSLNLFDKNSTSIAAQSGIYKNGGNGDYSVTFTVTAQVRYIRFYIASEETNNKHATISNLQIEFGEDKSDFAPYLGQQTYTIGLGDIELCKIGEYQDYIYKSGNDWYVHKATGKITFDGTEGWTRTDNSGNIYYWYNDTIFAKASSNTTAQPSFCEYLTPCAYNDAYNGIVDYGIGFSSTYNRIVIRNKDKSIEADFKSWLNTNNVTSYYILATPTDTKIIDNTLIGELEALYNATSYNDQTNFVVTSENLPAILQVAVYKKTLSGMIDVINNITDKDTTYTAGTNIQISPDNVISATDTTYTAGTNVSISAENVISATDTTYSDFVGTDGVVAGTAGLVPAPTAADADKFLKSDGTWDTAGGGGVTPVQTTGTSTTDVMSQDATTHMIYSSKNPSTWNGGGVVYMGNLDANQAQQPDPTTTANPYYKYFWALPLNNARVPQNGSINILGDNDTGDGTNTVILGADAHAFGSSTIAIGYSARGDYRCVAIGVSSCAGNWDNIDGAVAIGLNSFAKGGNYAVHIGGNSGNAYGVRGSSSANSIAIGKNSSIIDLTNSVALGAYSKATRQGEVNVGLVNGETTGGYNSTAYRVIGGVHDGQELHDVATVAQGNTLATSAPTTSTVGVLGQLYTDTTTMHTYQCTAIAGSTYTWTQRW